MLFNMVKDTIKSFYEFGQLPKKELIKEMASLLSVTQCGHHRIPIPLINNFLRAMEWGDLDTLHLGKDKRVTLGMGSTVVNSVLFEKLQKDVLPTLLDGLHLETLRQSNRQLQAQRGISS